jgi:hypothetical protein
MIAAKSMLPPYILISKRFRAYDKTIRDIWESYHFHNFYLPIVHRMVKKGDLPAFVLPGLGQAAGTHARTSSDTLGAISHISQSVSPPRSVIYAVSHTESFLQYLAIRVLRDYPKRLTGKEAEPNAREEKLLDIILNSDSKREMLDRIIEERVRALFYGAPVDFFLKDKARLGFGVTFKDTRYKAALDTFAEVTARRNLLIHNDGRVDRKYLREVENSGFALGQKLPVDTEYLLNALITLRGLSATAGIVVCQEIYGNKAPSGIMFQRHKAFKP